MTSYSNTTAPDLLRQQKQRAIDLFGLDEAAQWIPPFGSAFPATSAAYAVAVADDWLTRAAPGAIERAVALAEEGPICTGIAHAVAGKLRERVIPGPVPVAGLGGITTIPNLDDCAAVLGGFCHANAAGDIVRQLRSIYGSIKVGAFARRYTADGQRIMNAESTRIVWDGLQQIAIDVGAISGTHFESGDYWKLFKEELAETSEVIGEAAGEVAEALGDAVGKATGSFLEGLGFVKVGIAAGAVYLGVKYL